MHAVVSRAVISSIAPEVRSALAVTCRVGLRATGRRGRWHSSNDLVEAIRDAITHAILALLIVAAKYQGQGSYVNGAALIVTVR